MRTVVVVAVILLCQVGMGCSLLNKKKPAAQTAGGAGDSTWPSANGTAAPKERPATPTALSGVLAGQVVDGTQRRPPATAIQVVSAQDAAGPKAAPIEVLADANGYFVIQGLKPGQPYELIARAKDGDRTLAGREWVRPPNPKILIRMSEDLATSTTPPVPAHPQVPGQRPLNSGGAQSALPHDNAWEPGRGLANDGRRSGATLDLPGRSGDLGPPLRAEPSQPSFDAPAPAPRPNENAWPPNITSIPPQVERTPPPPPQPNHDDSADAPPLSGPAHGTAAPVPSCMLLGDRLHNLALRDLEGNTWEYRRRTGKLVLLDFWYTACPPCRDAIYHLKDLQKRYGPELEVVGIAYETGSLPEQVRKVRSLAERMEINYRLLLGSGQDVPCPVRDQFRVFNYPTLVLLGESGQVLKKFEGVSAAHLRDLELLIQHHLGVARRN